MYELNVRFADGSRFRQVYGDYAEAQDARDLWYDQGAVHVWITRQNGGDLPDTRALAVAASLPGDESMWLI